MRWIVALLCALTVGSLSADSRPTLSGRVTRVIDGDTIDVELQSGQIRVRLYGIDAPEKNQPYGAEATAALKALVGDAVDLEPTGQDRYDRMIARVFAGDLDVNLEMIQRGQAWAFRRYLGRSDVEFCRAEDAARRAKLGLWAGQAVAPWEWRARSKRPVLTDYSQETAVLCENALGRK